MRNACPRALAGTKTSEKWPPISAKTRSSKAIVGRTLFDLDATRNLNEQFPLSVPQQAAESKRYRAFAARCDRGGLAARGAAGSAENARQLVPTMKTLVPELKPLLDDYQSALADEASKFSAIYVWLKNPGLQPVVTSGIGRRTPVNEQDSLETTGGVAQPLIQRPQRRPGRN